MIDPIAFTLGPLNVHWYGLFYGLGLLLVLLGVHMLAQKRRIHLSLEQLTDLLFWMFLLGVVLSGRMGYVLFYNLTYYLAHPAKIPAIWEGGMSFHGGLMGAALVVYFYAKKHKIDLLQLTDLIVIPGALALALGRLGNFINGELVGRVIENPRFAWLGIDFGDGLLRYPSQLFAAGKDVLIFAILLTLFYQKPTLKKGELTAISLMLYGAFRFLVEFFRAPDEQIGFIFSFLTLGQVLSMGVFIFGLALRINSKKWHFKTDS